METVEKGAFYCKPPEVSLGPVNWAHAKCFMQRSNFLRVSGWRKELLNKGIVPGKKDKILSPTHMWPLQRCTHLRWSQPPRGWMWERAGFSDTPKFSGVSSKQVSVSRCVPTDAPDSPVPLCSLSSVVEKGTQLFQAEKNICRVPWNSTRVLSFYKWTCNVACCNKPLSFSIMALKPHYSSSWEWIKAEIVLLLFCQP